MECIVLAGGLGTRLKNTIGDHPKCMAPVNGLPFLHYLFSYLAKQGCGRVILSLGYKHEAVLAWLDETRPPFAVDYVVEKEPLGTGGGIRLAMSRAKAPEVFVLNGDTFFDVSLRELAGAHRQQQAETSLALKIMEDFDRYGSVRIDDTGRILAFEEKKYQQRGLINGGVYLISREAFLSRGLPEHCSFEKDYLEAYVGEGRFSGLPSDGYFIDIGIPEDYSRAQMDFKQLFP